MLANNKVFLAAAVAIPVGLLALAGWLNFRQVEAEARQHVRHTTAALREHAQRTLRSHELIIRFVDRHVQGWSWDRITSSRELHELLAHLVEGNEDVASIFMLDPHGRAWMSSRRFPMPEIDGTDRDYFRALRERDGLYISEVSTGRLQGDRFFALASRRSSANGEFDGIIGVSVDPQYFESFYATLLRTPQDAAGLARTDGVILVRAPRLRQEWPVIPATAAFMRELAAGKAQGDYIARSAGDGVERLHAYMRVGNYPVFASFQLGMGEVWAAWRREMLPYTLACLLAMGLLLAGVRLAEQRARRAEAEGRTREAEAASQAKDRFIAALSHELRNPLAAIGYAAEALGRSPAGAGTREPAAVIARQVVQLRRVLDDLLDTARAVYGKLALDQRRVDLRALAETVVADQPRPPGVQFTFSSGADSWVQGDPLRLKQMIGNLVENAIKYGGRCIDIVIEPEGESVSLAVRDDGHGIERELLERLFEPFVQGEQALDRANGGLGLGLALVHRLAALHGGTLGAESAGPGQGSTFTLRLPRAGPPARALAPAVQVERRFRLLVVEDQADARESLRSLLTLEGHEVVTAGEGAAALVLADRFAPEAALLDIGLPGMDGYELARRIRERWPQVSLVAVTGYGQREDRERASAAGFDAHLTKPFTYDELLRVLGRIDRRAAA